MGCVSVFAFGDFRPTVSKDRPELQKHAFSRIFLVFYPKLWYSNINIVLSIAFETRLSKVICFYIFHIFLQYLFSEVIWGNLDLPENLLKAEKKTKVLR